MCLREWCIKCRQCLSGEEARVPREDPPESPGQYLDDRSGSEEEPPVQGLDLYAKVVSPVTPPRPNRYKIEAALKEDYGRQISSVSDDTPEALQRQSTAFRSFQAKTKTEKDRKRNTSSPGKLETAQYNESRIANQVEISGKETEEKEREAKELAVGEDSGSERGIDLINHRYMEEYQSETFQRGSSLELIDIPDIPEIAEPVTSYYVHKEPESETHCENKETEPETESIKHCEEKETEPQSEAHCENKETENETYCENIEIETGSETYGSCVSKETESETYCVSRGTETERDPNCVSKETEPEENPLPPVVNVKSEDSRYPTKPEEEVLQIHEVTQTDYAVLQYTEEALLEINIDDVIEEGDADKIPFYGKTRDGFGGQNDRTFTYDPHRQIDINKAEKQESEASLEVNKPKNDTRTKQLHQPTEDTMGPKQNILGTGVMVDASTSVTQPVLDHDKTSSRDDWTVPEHKQTVSHRDKSSIYHNNHPHSSHPGRTVRYPDPVKRYQSEQSLTVQSEWDPDYTSITSSIRMATGQTVTNVDRRGIIRGPCAVCQDCDQYEVQSGLGCEYCGCPPGKHNNMGFFNQIAKSGETKPVMQVAGMSASYQHIAPTSSSHHQSIPRIAIQQEFNSPVQGHTSAPTTARTAEKGRKPLSVADLSTLPDTWTVEDAVKYLDLDRAQSTEFVNRHCSSPELNVEQQSANLSTRSEFSDFGSTTALAAGPSHTAYDQNRTLSPMNRAVSPMNVPQQQRMRSVSEDGDAFETESPSEVDGTEYAEVSTSRSLSLTLRQDSREEKCRIVQLNGGDVIRGTLKEPVTLRVDIFPRGIKKQHVIWFHNNKKISPRYRVRFVNDRREVQILSLRKKDAGVYKCQIKYTDGKETSKTACTMILDVQVPIYVAADL